MERPKGGGIGKGWQSWMQNILRSAVCVFALSANAYCSPGEIAAASLRLQILTKAAGLTIVDVRPPADYAKSHIQGAVNVPAQGIERAGLDRKARIVVYCSEADCPLSAGAAKALSAAGKRASSGIIQAKRTAGLEGLSGAGSSS